MKPVEIKPGIFWVGVNDQTTDLFEGLWPVRKEGVSYNSYLIVDKKKVVIDLIKPIKTEEYLIGLESMVSLKEIDYIVLNHLEPDHAGLLMTFSQLARQAKFICSAKAAEMIPKFLKVNNAGRFLVVKDGETIGLGEKSLQFFSTPFLHWPETMMTFEKAPGYFFPVMPLVALGQFMAEFLMMNLILSSFMKKKHLDIMLTLLLIIVSELSGQLRSWQPYP